MNIVLDGENRPVCIIETTEVNSEYISILCEIKMLTIGGQ
jgi:uncharacterized protein YhfF